MAGMHVSKAGQPESELARDDAEHLADVMRALASPVRLRILGVLRAGSSTVTHLSDYLNLGQPVISNHLRILRHLNLVSGERRGRNVFYELFDDHVADLLDQAIAHIEHLPQRDAGASTQP